MLKAPFSFKGQAAHWFDYQKLWPSLARMLKPGGTVAMWVSAVSMPFIRSLSGF